AAGRETRVVRERPSELAALRRSLAELTAPGAAALEPARRAAVLDAMTQRLEAEESLLRAQDAEAIVARYTRRAIVGAMAAVAPGSDLVIQGALATAMLRELTRLYGVGLKHLDLDAFVARAGATVRTTSALALAIAGNALKAFPGLGTIGGGIVHALAYGLIFDSLGRAVAQTLASRAPLDEVAVQRFEAALRHPEGPRVGAVLRIARDALRDPAPTDTEERR
ncbi:MAG TPA: GTP-binding protein HSR1, partial [Xanthomonadales bacterium]|nr:GTP-binding protein HSR1 [Xanthomonadales bacterium]